MAAVNMERSLTLTKKPKQVKFAYGKVRLAEVPLVVYLFIKTSSRVHMRKTCAFISEIYGLLNAAPKIQPKAFKFMSK